MRAIFEAGIGEDRAVVMDGDRLVEAHIERAGVRVGDVWDARLLSVEGGRGRLMLGDEEAVLDALPAGATEGGLLRVQVRRETIAGCVIGKPAKLRALDEAPARVPGRIRAGPALRARLLARGLPITDTAAHGPDLLEAAGWSETIEDAYLFRPIAFDGGQLVLDRTEAMLVVDVDGHLAPAPLALAAAQAVARTIRRLSVGGSTVVDFPTVADRDIRRQIGAIVDAELAPPFERTAVNGFGLMQIVRPRERPSLIEQVSPDSYATDAFRLLRIAERATGAGATVIAAMPGVIAFSRTSPRADRGAGAAHRQARHIAGRSHASHGGRACPYRGVCPALNARSAASLLPPRTRPSAARAAATAICSTGSAKATPSPRAPTPKTMKPRWTACLRTRYSRALAVEAPCPGSSGVEQGIENPRVGGSNPPPGTTRTILARLSLRPAPPAPRPAAPHRRRAPRR